MLARNKPHFTSNESPTSDNWVGESLESLGKGIETTYPHFLHHAVNCITIRGKLSNRHFIIFQCVSNSGSCMFGVFTTDRWIFSRSRYRSSLFLFSFFSSHFCFLKFHPRTHAKATKAEKRSRLEGLKGLCERQTTLVWNTNRRAGVALGEGLRVICRCGAADRAGSADPRCPLFFNSTKQSGALRGGLAESTAP